MIVHILFQAILLSELAITSTAENTLLYNFSCSGNGNYTPKSLFQFSLFNLLGNLTTEASQSGFYKASYGQSPNQVFGDYLCRGDLNNQNCSNCVLTAKNTILEKCPYQVQAMIWFPDCMVRFSNDSFFGRMDVTPRGFLMNEQNVTGNQTTLFAKVLGDTMNRLAVAAATDKQQWGKGKKFATQEVNMSSFSFKKLYAVTQCTPDLTVDACIQCLQIAIKQLYVKLGAAGIRVLQPSCCLRYEIYPFFNQNSPASQTNQRGMRRILVPIAISISIILLLGVCIWMCNCGRKKKPTGTSKLPVNEITTVDSLQFNLTTIRAATNNFSIHNKLGEGGFGEVYKGILEDGREIAIKRLSKNSVQGIEEFKTEVDLVANLQHKNLVKLLGFCLASKENILVYEFLQNSSLDQFLFDATKKIYLGWETRYKLIIGIARGLLYLHEDSRLKIIHRDLKPSNILLDEGMNPKISDFGLARLFGVDQTQGDTKRIVGTYGYMAPEYAMTGHFSVKSDVYSFGIIVLEIVSGQKNRFFGRPQAEEALLHRAWRLWNESKAVHLVDTTLASNYPREEVTKCIHISLLCIQENAAERPTMATIVAALNGPSMITLPMPKAPNCFESTATSPEVLSLHYDEMVGGNEIVYVQEWDPQGRPYVYSGTETITYLHPRW